MFYAELNEQGVCIAVTQPGRPPEGSRFVPVDSIDAGLLGKSYEDGQFVDVEPEPD